MSLMYISHTSFVCVCVCVYTYIRISYVERENETFIYMYVYLYTNITNNRSHIMYVSMNRQADLINTESTQTQAKN